MHLKQFRLLPQEAHSSSLVEQSGRSFESSLESSEEPHFENLPVAEGSVASKYAVF